MMYRKGHLKQRPESGGLPSLQTPLLMYRLPVAFRYTVPTSLQRQWYGISDMAKAKRAALYLRVSTDGQTTENQRQALVEAAEVRGWNVAHVYEDHGISGSKGRDKRPGLDRMLKDATRGKFDVVMAWSVDRIGRSLSDLLGVLSELQGAGVDLFLQQQAIDTTTPAGRAMFGMLGVFAEFERSIIQSRINAGIDRARKKGKHLGRPKLPEATAARIRAMRAEGVSLRKVAAGCGVALSTVQGVLATEAGA
jgi:DNA invertase Pin-like site-specific DNA recombinase